MNLKLNPTPRWIERGSIFLLGALFVSTSAMAASTGGEVPVEEATLKSPAPIPQVNLDALHEALAGGRFWVNLRYRFENVDQDDSTGVITKDAHASTLRTRLGYETADFNGLSGVLEFSNVSNVTGKNDNYNDGTGPANRPKVIDPKGSLMNQVYVQYSGGLPGKLKAGRQRIKLGKDRFIGNVGWRQTEQTYDAITYSADFGNGLGVYYGYLDRANNIKLGKDELNSHILNLSMEWENMGTLTAYGYYLDFPDDDAKSSFTYGARFAGDNDLGDFALLYGAEVAKQDDIKNDGKNVDASYNHFHLGLKAQGLTGKVGFESLEGTLPGPQNLAFQTPLATKHAWNGWADKFLTTPARGLQDFYVHLGYGSGPLSAALIYHEFDPETGSGDYGTEFDVVFKYNASDDLTLGLKAADYNADGSGTPGSGEDTRKAWFWLAYSW